MKNHAFVNKISLLAVLFLLLDVGALRAASDVNPVEDDLICPDSRCCRRCPAGPEGPRGRQGPRGPEGACTCSSGCLVGMVVTFFGTDFPLGPVPLPNGTAGATETFGPTSPVNQSITASAWDLSHTPLTLYNKDLGVGTGEQGLGIDGTVDHEILASNFIQLDMSNVLSLSPVPDMVELTIQSIQLNEGFAIYLSNDSGMIGTFYASQSNTGTEGVIQTISIPLSSTSKRYINITATQGDVLLSAISIPQCEMLTAPLLLVVNSSLMPASVTGSFIGQLAFFQIDNKLRTWAGSVVRWVP